MTVAVHKIVAQAAKGIAGAFYEEAASDNAFFAMWPNQRAFVRKCWSNFIDPARESLVKALGSPNLDQSQRDEIYVALLRDGALNPSYQEAQAANGVTPTSGLIH